MRTPIATNFKKYLAALVLFLFFAGSLVSSAISVWLAVKWGMKLELVHYLSFAVTVTSYSAAKWVLSTIKPKSGNMDTPFAEL